VLSSLATILLVVVVALPLTLWLLQERLIFLPQPLGEAQRAAIKQRHPAVREVFLESGAHAWHLPGEPLVIYFGGNAEEVSWMLQNTPRVGWLLVNYPGYGASKGAPSEETISADALRWYDYAAKEIKPSKVVVFGRSLGSGPAVLIASERKVDGAILVTPFDSLIEVAKRHYPFLPVRLMLRHQFESVVRAPKIAAPLLCIAAARDDIIPSSHARKLYDAWGGPKRWVELEEAGHNTTDAHPLFWDNIKRFLQ
jgi:pimeloyl-ACP methyl ester carboxylesterase